MQRTARASSLCLCLSPLPPCPACREEELPELEQLRRQGAVPHDPQGGMENKQGKANMLIQVRWRRSGLSRSV